MDTASQAENAGKNVLPTLIRILVGLGLLLPAGLCSITQFIAPAVRTLMDSLQNARALQGGAAEFVGGQNYARLLEDELFISALGFTALLLVVRLLVVAVVPLLLSLAANVQGRAGRGAVRVLLTVPVALCVPGAAFLAWRLLLAPGTGLLPRPWSTSPEGARAVVLAVDALVTFGLACGVGGVFYLSALRGGSLKTKWLPLSVTWLAGLLATAALSLQSFSASYLLTAGGPANATTSLALLYYRLTFQRMAFGVASALAVPLLVTLMVLGLIVGLTVVASGLKLVWAPIENSASPRRKVLALVLLVPALLITSGACVLVAAPLAWSVARSMDGEAYTRLGHALPIGAVTLNTLLPTLISVFLLQLPLAYLGALGIGVLRPLGKWSTWLLLPFSPWLFVGVLPFAVDVFRRAIEAGRVNSLAGLISPLTLSVPMLFVLTLFFAGQAGRWQAARDEGQPAARAFFTQLILPSLPLTALLGCVGLFAGLQDLFWPLLAANRPESFTWTVALALLAGQFASSASMMTAGIVLFWLPLALFFLPIFSLLQVLYLDRLSLAREA